MPISHSPGPKPSGANIPLTDGGRPLPQPYLPSPLGGPLALALVLGVQGLVTRMVSWHWALYRAFFRVPWRALVPEPPSQDPQFSNLYLQSAGGRVPWVRAGRPVASLHRPTRVSSWLCPPFVPSACAPPHLQTPSSSCTAPCIGCAESGPRRHLRGNPHRSPCCWGCRAPRSTPSTRSPGCPSSLCLKRTGNRAQDLGHGETHWGIPSRGPDLGTQAAH